jgi:hypothetical protein
MRRFLLWVQRFLHWLFVEPWLSWVTLLVLVAVYYLRSEPAFRIAGGLFQLFGVGVVALGHPPDARPVRTAQHFHSFTPMAQARSSISKKHHSKRDWYSFGECVPQRTRLSVEQCWSA